MTYPAVYRLFNAEGHLLYIGSSSRLIQRMAGSLQQHLGFNWRDVVRIRVEHFDTIAEARAAEGRAILAEQPLLNKVGKKGLSVPRHCTDSLIDETSEGRSLRTLDAFDVWEAEQVR